MVIIIGLGARPDRVRDPRELTANQRPYFGRIRLRRVRKFIKTRLLQYDR